MKFALIKGKRTEATKGAKGICEICEEELVAKCGEIKVHHWAHKGNRDCDPWWENETDWHRSWKDQFPNDWQEVPLEDDSGKKHRADVKTESGWVLEFQHSPLEPEKRSSRNAFYPKLVWVVDALRRKNDKKHLKIIQYESTRVMNDPYVLRVDFPEKYRLLNEWHDSSTLVFFDLRQPKESRKSFLWFLVPGISTSEAYISIYPLVKFIDLHNKNKFNEFESKIILHIHNQLVSRCLIKREDINYQIKNENNVNSRTKMLSGFDRLIEDARRRQGRGRGRGRL